jgi:hypothetical protein
MRFAQAIHLEAQRSLRAQLTGPLQGDPQQLDFIKNHVIASEPRNVLGPGIGRRRRLARAILLGKPDDHAPRCGSAFAPLRLGVDSGCCHAE